MRRGGHQGIKLRNEEGAERRHVVPLGNSNGAAAKQPLRPALKQQEQDNGEPQLLPASSMSNPIFSPDDSLLRAATKLAGLKLKPQAGPSNEAAGDEEQRQAAPSAYQIPELQRGTSPELPDASHKPEDAPRLAARTAIRERRKSVFHPQRYGQWFSGDDMELDQQLKAYNHSE
jgi:hypothetical protein